MKEQKENAMRVTHDMMIRNSIYWTAKQTERLSSRNDVVASGKTIGKLSDDPAAAEQILGDRATLSRYEQSQTTIEQADTWLEASNTTLETVNELLRQAGDVVEACASCDENTAEAYLGTLMDIYGQVLDLANSTYGSRYMYAGDQSDSAPFRNETVVAGGSASPIDYGLAADASTVTIEISSSSGDIVRTLSQSNGVAGVNDITWDGCDDSGAPLPDGTYSFTVSAADSNGDAVGTHPIYRGNAGGREFYIGDSHVVRLNNNGDALFGEALRVLGSAIAAVRQSGTSLSVSDLGSALDDAVDGIEAEQVKLSNGASLLSNRDVRLDELTLAVQDHLSGLEDADSTEATIRLQAQQTAYEVTMEAASLILKLPKLSDYI
jgi:flagellin-like hook-associated protein FlgL